MQVDDLPSKNGPGCMSEFEGIQDKLTFRL